MITPQDLLLEEEPVYAESMSASIKHMITFGKRRGQRVRFDYRRDICPRLSSGGSLSAYVDGFSLHAGVNIRSHRRDALEKLIGYVARPTFICKKAE